MIRYIYVCITHNKNWPIGQYFIVDEDREYFVTGRPVPAGPRGKFRIEATSEIELPFNHTVKPFVRQVGQEEEEPSDDNSDIFTGLN